MPKILAQASSETVRKRKPDNIGDIMQTARVAFLVRVAGLEDTPSWCWPYIATLMKRGRYPRLKHMTHPDCIPIHCRELSTWFRHDRALYTRVRDTIFEKPTESYSFTGKKTKPYKQKQSIRERWTTMEIDYKPEQSTGFIYADGTKVRNFQTSKARKRSGVYLQSIPRWVPVNLQAIEMAIPAIEQWVAHARGPVCT